MIHERPHPQAPVRSVETPLVENSVENSKEKRAGNL